MLKTDDQKRLRIEYACRDRRLADTDTYSPLNPANLFMFQERKRATQSLLRGMGIESLNDFQILEVGCGRGGVLLEYMRYGASPSRLNGTDLLLNRICDAHVQVPGIRLTCADGQSLPYRDNTFNLVMQYTVFSSILDREIKANVAREMLRVVKKPDGLILSYDFWLNPANPQTRGIRPKEIRALFPDCRFEFNRITLAPPITRRLIKVSWVLCHLLEQLRIFNSHYLVGIHPSSGCVNP